MIYTDGSFEIDGGFKLHYKSWTSATPRASILLAHGFAEHAGRYEHLARFFTAHDINVFAFDHPGHGASDGKRGHARDYNQLMAGVEGALQQVRKLQPDLPVILYAHSMGGNIMLNYFFKKQPIVAGVIASAPWIHLAKPAPAIKVAIGKLLRNILPSMTQPTELNESLLSTDPTVGERYVADPLVQTRISNALGIDILGGANYLASLKTAAAYPLLLMHGGADQIIAPRGSKELAARLSGPVTLKIWEGLYHEIHNEYKQEEVFDFTLNWIEKNILAQNQ